MFTFAQPAQRPLADQLMQPVLIRVIDNLRKHMENQGISGTYHQDLLWPQGTTEAQRQQVTALQAQLETATETAVAGIEHDLAQLPRPFPAYRLELSLPSGPLVVDVWDLCCQVCFQQYDPAVPVTVDLTLVDDDGDIDWVALDAKAKGLVEGLGVTGPD